MKRSLEISLKTAKEWYFKGGDLRDLALSVFTEKELQVNEFQKLTDFDKVLQYLQDQGIVEDAKKTSEQIEDLSCISKSVAACTKLGLIQMALNLEYQYQDPYYRGTGLTDLVYVPRIFISYMLPRQLEKGVDIVGEYKFGDESYQVLSFPKELVPRLTNQFLEGGTVIPHDPVEFFKSILRCGSSEIAAHFGRYFWKEIIEATKIEKL